jgi:hypothetical protein
MASMEAIRDGYVRCAGEEGIGATIKRTRYTLAMRGLIDEAIRKRDDAVIVNAIQLVRSMQAARREALGRCRPTSPAPQDNAPARGVLLPLIPRVEPETIDHEGSEETDRSILGNAFSFAHVVFS